MKESRADVPETIVACRLKREEDEGNDDDDGCKSLILIFAHYFYECVLVRRIVASFVYLYLFFLCMQTEKKRCTTWMFILILPVKTRRAHYPILPSNGIF